MTTSIRYDDNRGGLDYPFLDDAWQWEIVSHPLTADLAELPIPTLRWVKDNKVLDLHIPNGSAPTGGYIKHLAINVLTHGRLVSVGQIGNHTKGIHCYIIW